MEGVRREIDRDYEELVDDARSLFDWRVHVRAHPFMAMGLACALGATVVPRKNETVKADSDQLGGMMKDDEVVVAPNSKVKQSSVAATVMSTVAGVLLRTAIAHASNSATSMLSGKNTS